MTTLKETVAVHSEIIFTFKDDIKTIKKQVEYFKWWQVGSILAPFIATSTVGKEVVASLALYIQNFIHLS